VSISPKYEIMKCLEVEKLILKSSENPENNILTEEIKLHISNCKNCNQFFHNSNKIDNFIQSRKFISEDDLYFSRLLARINNIDKTEIPQRQNIFNVKYYRTIAASILIIVAVGIGILTGNFSANIYSNNSELSSEQLASEMGVELVDNSFDLTNFNEQ